jgi:hypothetical protein
MGIESSLLISARTSSAAWKKSPLEVGAPAEDGAEAEAAGGAEGAEGWLGGATGGGCCAHDVATNNIAAQSTAKRQSRRIIFGLPGGIESIWST